MSATAEKMEFQTEVKQLLHLMIHSLYSHKEIFLRELISNAADAIDKVKFEGLSNADLIGNDSDFRIKVELNKEANQIIISDNGIGMNRDDLIAHLGTIARSGTKAFMENLTGDSSKDVSLIGQFGVGFYSLFMVASSVEVNTLKAGESQAYFWKSEGDGDFEIGESEKSTRGTEITLHLKEDEKEFVDAWQTRSVITKYSEYVTHPIVLEFEEETPAKEEGEAAVIEQKSEILNEKPALWRRSKSDIEADEYKEFYKHISSDSAEPLVSSHNKVEGTQEYTTLLYVPSKAPHGIFHQDTPNGLKLYVKRVFIMDDCKELLPNYLRFVRGIVDSEDLPLNVSREILQSNKVVENIKKHITKKVLAELKKFAQDNPTAYHEWWAELGNVLKEGFYMNWENLDELKALLRFQSTNGSSSKDLTSLTDYVSRMREDQKDIYYISGESRAAVESSPHLEIFKAKGIEVLYLVDPIDEWVTQSLFEFDGKSLKNITKGEIDLGEDSKEEKEKTEEAKGTFKDLLEGITKHLDSNIKEARLTSRLKDSPCCLVADENDMTANMERIMKMSGQTAPVSKRILEINPEHAISQKLLSSFEKGADSEVTTEVMDYLYYQALIAEGSELPNPGQYVKLVNKMLANHL